jgi:gamma-glutamyltranspeptidase/glutathione hydrolase
MSVRGTWRPDRDEVVAENGVVTAMHPLAAEAGLEMLKKGGNAVDAAVATGFAISVVEPNNTSIAGVGFMLVHLETGTGKYPPGTDLVIEYGPRAPKAARPDMYKITGPGAGISTYAVEGNENEEGYRSIAMPGTAAGLCVAHELLGKLPLAQVMEPAIHLAQEGFDVYWLLSLMIGSSMAGLQRYPGSRDILLPGGVPPDYTPDPSSPTVDSHRLIQSDLADVLKRIAKFGRAGMYRGEVADAAAEDMRRNGGLITRDDLAEYEPVVKTPLATNFRDFRVLAPTAPSGSWTALETLNILENFDLRSMGHNSAEHLHTWLEGARHAFADRFRYMGDPDFVDVPLKALLSKEYAKQVAGQMDAERAAVEALSDEPPWTYFATQAIHDPWPFEGRPRPTDQPVFSTDSSGDCTTHLGAADRDGNIVSCTQTAVSSFGSRVVTPGLGFIWNNGMVWFNAKPGANNSIAPWKRPLVNMAPLLATKQGKPYLSVGSPGGRQVINANINVALNILEFGMSPQEAITASRTDAAGPMNLVDSRLDGDVVEALRRMGHRIEVVSDIEAWYRFARPSAILVDRDQGVLRAGTHLLQTAESVGF